MTVDQNPKPDPEAPAGSSMQAEETLGWIPHHTGWEKPGPIFETKAKAAQWIAERSPVDEENWFMVRDTLERGVDVGRATRNEADETTS